MLTLTDGGVWSDEGMQNFRPQERRRSRRLRIGEPLKVRPTDPRGETFEDISATKNVSREGFYFLTPRKAYQEGMRLFVTLPFHGAGDLRNQEYVGQVLRVDMSREDQWGVAVQLLSPVKGEGKS
jgi:hypothetical protein